MANVLSIGTTARALHEQRAAEYGVLVLQWDGPKQTSAFGGTVVVNV